MSGRYRRCISQFACWFVGQERDPWLDTSVLWLLQQIEETALNKIMAALDDNQPASAADLK